MERTILAVFKKPQQIKEALEELQGESLANSKISVIVRSEYTHQGNFHEEIANELSAFPTERTLDMFNAWLVQVPPFEVDNLGEVNAAGPLAHELLKNRDGQTLVDALVAYGLNTERALYYEHKVRTGHFLTLVQTNEDKAQSAANLFQKFGGHDIETWRKELDHPVYPAH